MRKPNVLDRVQLARIEGAIRRIESCPAGQQSRMVNLLAALQSEKSMILRGSGHPEMASHASLFA